MSERTEWWAALAWLGGNGGVAHDVLITVEGERIVAVVGGTASPPSGAVRLPGAVLPGLVNAHSHAFHRALRGRTQEGRDSFWTWRDAMYGLAATLEPNTYRELATAVYAEMVAAGITAVGEFHYLHHQSDGRSYQDANAMGLALVEAAETTGIRLTLLDTCYLRGGFDAGPAGVQVRFSDGTAEAWVERVDALWPSLENHPLVRLGAAVHSVRAVGTSEAAAVAQWARRHHAPLHVHVSEQIAENEACMAATGRTPTEVLDGAGVLGSDTTAVHAIHLTPKDRARFGATGTMVCACPTTERDLADGVVAGEALVAAGCRLCFGSDSHAVIDLFEEARALELDQRLMTGRRGIHTSSELLDTATAGGARSLGWDAGVIEPGRLADFIAVDVESPRLRGFDPDDLDAHLVFAASAADVTHVVVGGRLIVDGRQPTG